ncbi:MAG: D-2-hydroxyacid dehydrogenase [Paracoccaceae bacterium]
MIIHAADPMPHVTTLQPLHPGVSFTPCDNYEGLPDLIADLRPDAVFSTRFAGTPTYPTTALLGPDGPRWISVGGSGVDHLGRWDKSKVTVTNAAGVAASMMAEYVFGCLLQFSLGIPDLNADKAARKWADRIVAPLRGRTLLIVGLGNTGRAVAALAKAFGMNVIGTRARPLKMCNVDHVYSANDLPQLWHRADAVVVCTPLLDSTKGIVNAAAFGAMKLGSVLVDVSRGGVVVQNDLIAALKNGQLAGAGLDVFEVEPLPEDNPLWDMENVILSPHCSSVFDGWEDASVLMFSDNLARFRAGAQLDNVVDPDRGY